MLRRRAAGPLRAVAVLLAAFVVTLSLLAACTGEEPAEPDAGVAEEPTAPVRGIAEAPPLPEQETGQQPVTVHTRVTRVVGHLSEERQEALARQVGRLLSAYVDGAVRGGTGSRTAFAAFTPGAARQARADAAVLAGLGGAGADGARGAEASEVEVTSARAWVSVLSPRGHIVGATARVAILAQPVGGASAVQLTGRLLLTPEKGWQVFGYDVARSRVAAGGAS